MITPLAKKGPTRNQRGTFPTNNIADEDDQGRRLNELDFLLGKLRYRLHPAFVRVLFRPGTPDQSACILERF
jgi:hypothetical protein